MSRAHAVAPLVDSEARFRKAKVALAPVPRAKRGSVGQPNSPYGERAMSLWPRLDIAKVRRCADDPARIAEIVEHRTSQPYAVIIAMLTRQTPGLGGLRDQQRTRIAASAADRNVRPVVIKDGSGTIDDLLIALDLGHDVALHLQGGQGDCDGSEV